MGKLFISALIIVGGFSAFGSTIEPCGNRLEGNVIPAQRLIDLRTARQLNHTQARDVSQGDGVVMLGAFGSVFSAIDSAPTELTIAQFVERADMKLQFPELVTYLLNRRAGSNRQRLALDHGIRRYYGAITFDELAELIYTGHVPYHGRELKALGLNDPRPLRGTILVVFSPEILEVPGQFRPGTDSRSHYILTGDLPVWSILGFVAHDKDIARIKEELGAELGADDANSLVHASAQSVRSGTRPLQKLPIKLQTEIQPYSLFGLQDPLTLDEILQAGYGRRINLTTPDDELDDPTWWLHLIGSRVRARHRSSGDEIFGRIVAYQPPSAGSLQEGPFAPRLRSYLLVSDEGDEGRLKHIFLGSHDIVEILYTPNQEPGRTLIRRSELQQPVFRFRFIDALNQVRHRNFTLRWNPPST